MVLVPGFGDPAAMWAPLMGELKGFTCHAVDRPCFGHSGTARHATATFRRLAVDFVEQVLDALGLEEPLFVANSIGSLWTLWLALDRPERVRAMAHVGCPAFVLGTSAPLPMRLLSIRPLGRLVMKLVPPSAGQVEAFARLVGEDLSEAPELVELLVASRRLPGAQRAIVDLLHAVLRARGARPEVVLRREHLERVAQPTLLCWGGKDPFGSVSVAETVARSLQDADLYVLPDAGHVPWVRHAGEVAAVVAPFLKGAAS